VAKRITAKSEPINGSLGERKQFIHMTNPYRIQIIEEKDYAKHKVILTLLAII